MQNVVNANMNCYFTQQKALIGKGPEPLAKFSAKDKELVLMGDNLDGTQLIPMRKMDHKS